MYDIRLANQRGHANHGWLDSWHSFSFGDYFDPEHVEFGALRVINEDRVAPGGGFSTHGHSDMEIISYVLEGALAHKDSMGNGSTIRPGDVQRMSAGTGVQHSEFNASKLAPVHFLQIWIQPNQKGIAPSYEERAFGEAEKRGRLRLIASPDRADGSVLIHQDARVYAGLFDAEEYSRLDVASGRRIYLHVASGAIKANGTPLGAGDAIMLTGTVALDLTDGHNAEVLAFDLP